LTGVRLLCKNVWVHKNTVTTAGTNEGGGIKVRDGWFLLDSCAISSDYTGDAGLVPFHNNGGSTKTHALDPSNPAVDAGNCFALSTDQRGYPRPVNVPGVETVADGCYIGAYEFDLKAGLTLVYKSD